MHHFVLGLESRTGAPRPVSRARALGDGLAAGGWATTRNPGRALRRPDETVSDDNWLRDAGDRREAVFVKDRRARYNPAERSMRVQTFQVWAFYLARKT